MLEVKYNFIGSSVQATGDNEISPKMCLKKKRKKNLVIRGSDHRVENILFVLFRRVC